MYKNEKKLKVFFINLGISLLLVSNYYFFYKQTFSSVIDINVILSLIFLFFFSIFLLYTITLCLKNLKNLNFYNFLLILFSCWVGVQTIKVFFISANFITISDLIIASNILFIFEGSDFLFRLIKFFFPYFLVILLIFFFRNLPVKIIKFSAVFGFILIIMCFYREFISNFSFSNSVLVFNYEKKTSVNFKINKNKKVMWLLMDEFDPEIAFKRFNENSFMNNFKDLQKESIYFDKFYGPARNTINSIPSTLMGIQGYGNYVKNYKYFLIDEYKNLHELKYDNTIFGRLNKLGIKSKIKSSLIPYCSAYIKFSKHGECLEPNIKVENQKYDYFSGIKYIYSITTKLKIIKLLFLKEKEKLKKNI